MKSPIGSVLSIFTCTYGSRFNQEIIFLPGTHFLRKHLNFHILMHYGIISAKVLLRITLFYFANRRLVKNYNNTFLADLTCLALLFGDEFIDRVCTEIGKPTVQQFLKDNGSKLYLPIIKKENGYTRPLVL